MRAGHCFSKRVLTSSRTMNPQPWRYLEAVWTQSWAAGFRWPCLSRRVGPNDIHRSLSASAILCFCELLTACLICPVHDWLLDFCEGWYCLRILVPDSVHECILSYYLMSRCVFLQINSKLADLNSCIKLVSEDLYATYVNLSFLSLSPEILSSNLVMLSHTHATIFEVQSLQNSAGFCENLAFWGERVSMLGSFIVWTWHPTIMQNSRDTDF